MKLGSRFRGNDEDGIYRMAVMGGNATKEAPCYLGREVCMSADVCVAYVGVRYQIEPTEIEALETRSDHRQLAAREAGLKSYWGNFGGVEERYVLFVGTELALLGPEAKPRLSVTAGELQNTIAQTEERLSRVGIDEAIGLHIEFQEDV